MFLKLKNISQKTIIILGLSLVSFILVGWFFQSDYPEIVKNRIFKEKITQIENVSLNDKKEEVFYKKGKPSYQVLKIPCDWTTNRCKVVILDNKFEFDKNFANLVDENYEFLKNNNWFYGDFEKYITVQFDKNNKVDGVRCISICSPVLGIKIGDDEERIFKIFGKYSRYNIKDGEKRIYYDDLNIRFVLKMSKVYGVELKIPSK